MNAAGRATVKIKPNQKGQIKLKRGSKKDGKVK